MLNKLNKYKNFIFDMDGTIIDSSEEVLKCLRLACEKSNAKIKSNILTSNIIGPPLREIIKNIIVEEENEQLIDKITTEFRSLYDEDPDDESTMYPNIKEWLLSLKKAGKLLFIATNKPQKPTLRLVKSFKLDFFEDIYTIDKFRPENISKADMIQDIISKFKLNKTETIMIGDSPEDIKSAHIAGIYGAGVLWGYGNYKTELIEISEYIIEKQDLKVPEKI